MSTKTRISGRNEKISFHHQKQTTKQTNKQTKLLAISASALVFWSAWFACAASSVPYVELPTTSTTSCLSLSLFVFSTLGGGGGGRGGRGGEGHHPGFSWDHDLKGKNLHLSFCLLEDSEKDTHPE